MTRRSFGVITEDTGASSFSSKRRSRCVTMPTTFVPMHHRHAGDARERVSSMTWRMVMSGETVIGSRITPLSNFLTRATSRACASMVMFLWMMPMPPSCAMVMARRASVTVSMAAESSGTIEPDAPRERVPRSTSRGRISE